MAKIKHCLKHIPAIFRNMPYGNKLMIAMACTVIVLMLFVVTTFLSVATNSISDMGTRFSEDNAARACALIEDYFAQISANSTQFLRLSSLQKVLKTDSAKDVSRLQEAELTTDIRELVDYSRAVSQIEYTMVNIYCKNGFSYTNAPNVQLPFDTFESCIAYYNDLGYFLNERGGSAWCNLVETLRVDQCKEISFVYVRPLYSSSSYQIEGLLLVAVSEASISQIYESYSPNAYVVHRSGLIVSASNKQLLGKQIPNQTEYDAICDAKTPAGTLVYENDNNSRMLSYRKIADNNAYVVIPFEYYRGLEKPEIQQMLNSCALITGACLIISLVVSAILAKSLSRSVQEIIDFSQAVSGGDRSIRYSSCRNDEVTHIGNSINAMLDYIEKANIEQQKQAARRQTLELQLLQSQFNPHLLYNSLSSVMWSLHNNDTKQAYNSLSAMSSFFKRSLSSGRDIIQLHEEIELLQSYLNVQNLTRNKNYSLIISLEKGMETLEIPKFILQPAIENSVLHGFTSFRDDGILQLTGTISSEFIRLDVEDNGIGIEEQALSTINAHIDSPETPTNNHSYGLSNVSLRIKNMFGQRSKIWLESTVGEKTVVHYLLYRGSEEEGSSLV